MNRLGTQKKILDAAESLFAHNGYHATSLRAITAKAGVNLAAVNYHFGSKESLLDNVFERRIVPLNRIRMEMLDSVRVSAEQKGVRPSVSDIMRAFAAPTISFRDSGKGARNFIALVGRAISEPQSVMRRSFLSFMEPFVFVMLGSLKEALPDMPDQLLFLRFHFAVGTLVQTLHMTDGQDMARQMSTLSGATGKSGAKGAVTAKSAASTERLVDEVVSFMTAGMEA
jgi:AcrR family transcriptional regulator